MSATADDEAYFERASLSLTQSTSREQLVTLLASAPTAQRLLVNTEVLMREFLDEYGSPSGAESPAPAAAPRPSVKSPTGKTSVASRSRGVFGSRLSSGSSAGTASSARKPTSPPAGAGRSSPVLVERTKFLEACAQLPTFADQFRQGTVLIGNGRSVLGQGMGPLIDQFARVVRFNDYVIRGDDGVDYSRDIGTKTDLWVVSDWTCMKMLTKYPTRSTVDRNGQQIPMPVLIAIPYKFMGKPYYAERRAELEKELTPEQRAHCTFVPMEVVQGMIEGNRFGDRWPSSGLITITHELSLLGEGGKLHLHGFDFFKQIDGKIHYMEDTHTANHHAAEEERLVMAHVKERRVNFLN